MLRLLILLSMVFACACSTQATKKPVLAVTAYAETTPVASSDDAADDPAIWLNSQDLAQSLILGTDKQSGLAVYNLRGEQVQFLPQGRLNNVDIRQGVPVGDMTLDIAVATNRTTTALDIFTIDSQGTVSFDTSQPLQLNAPYGVCLHLRDSAELVAFVNSKDGWYQQWLLNGDADITPVFEGEFLLDTQPEGCVVNDITDTLYVGEENHGIWKMPASYKAAAERVLIDATKGPNLTADVEGLAIYHNDGDSLLVASSQGDYSYAVYKLSDDGYVGSFVIVDDPSSGIDGAEETDGLAITSANLGGVFGKGLLVVQDGFNTRPNANQNFKLVPWQAIETKLVNLTDD